jgi:hypothetical protein
MVTKDFELRIPGRKVLIGIILTLVPISVVALYTVTRTEASIREAAGSRFATIATILASDVSGYVHDRVIQVAALARNPVVVDAVIAANRATQGESDAAFRARIEQTEKLWPTPAADPLVRNILGTPASRTFRELIAVDRRILRVLLTDLHGAVIAGSHKTVDYYQADEDTWQGIYAQGRGAVHVTDLRHDDVTKSDFVGIGVPVVDPSSSSFIGALRVLVDVTSLFPQAPLPATGPSFQRFLVKDDGTIVSGPGVTLAMDRKAAEHAAVRESIGDASRAAAGYLEAPVRGGGSVLIGYADTGLRADYNSLGLHVLVLQNSREALAGASGAITVVWILAVVSMAVVMLAIAYFSLHRRVKYEDVAQALAAGEVQGHRASAP